MNRRQWAGLGAAMLAAILATGCSRWTQTPDRLRQRHIGGQAGGSRGNRLRAGFRKGDQRSRSVTQIKDGHYETQPGLGVVGGAYIVRITPFDGVPNKSSMSGNVLLSAPHVEHVEFPEESTTRDFDIPAPRNHRKLTTGIHTNHTNEMRGRDREPSRIYRLS